MCFNQCFNFVVDYYSIHGIGWTIDSLTRATYFTTLLATAFTALGGFFDKLHGDAKNAGDKVQTEYEGFYKFFSKKNKTKPSEHAIAKDTDGTILTISILMIAYDAFTKASEYIFLNIKGAYYLKFNVMSVCLRSYLIPF